MKFKATAEFEWRRPGETSNAMRLECNGARLAWVWRDRGQWFFAGEECGSQEDAIKAAEAALGIERVDG